MFDMSGQQSTLCTFLYISCPGKTGFILAQRSSLNNIPKVSMTNVPESSLKILTFF